jgi:tRNA dimethylallyltransferase
MPKSLILIAGATATGKTDFAIQLARDLKTEIISADSRQVFREMCIGTAVPEKEQLESVRHHLIGHISIQQEYSAGIYAGEARQCIDVLHKTHDVVIMCGGSGLYIDAALRGLDDLPQADPQVRQQLQRLLDSEGIQCLQQRLLQLDPSYAAEVDMNNPRRLIRALELIMSSGLPYSELRKGEKAAAPEFRIYRFCLSLPRAVLHDRINLRVDAMMEAGLLKEAEGLYRHKQLKALQSVGYQELFKYFDGQISLENAVADIKTNTRRYAKRQETWFRRDKDYCWLDASSPLENQSIVLGSLDSATN